MFVVFLAAYALFYILPNLHPNSPPAYLPMLRIDEMIPFEPATFLIYLSIYGMFIFTPFFIKDMETFNALSRRMFATLFICGAFFLFFPTTYPRPEYPDTHSAVINFCMWLVGSADTPNNCFPSLHVAGTGVTTYTIKNQGKKMFRLYVIWTLAIFVSTVTTKQHYFIDVVGGIGVIVTVAALDHILFAKRVFKGLIGR
jgi:membrane-associated phospholipid phosphatase